MFKLLSGGESRRAGACLRKNQQILQKFERCLKRILQIEAVQKCENLVDLEKINAEKCVFG